MPALLMSSLNLKTEISEEEKRLAKASENLKRMLQADYADNVDALTRMLSAASDAQRQAIRDSDGKAETVIRILGGGV